jgi:hypothetical protein
LDFRGESVSADGGRLKGRTAIVAQQVGALDRCDGLLDCDCSSCARHAEATKGRPLRPVLIAAARNVIATTRSVADEARPSRTFRTLLAGVDEIDRAPARLVRESTDYSMCRAFGGRRAADVFP